MHIISTPIESADAFAITLEKKVGNPAPALSQLYVMGEIKFSCHPERSEGSQIYDNAIELKNTKFTIK